MLGQTKEPWEFAGKNGVEKSLLGQFQGSDGRRRLIDALIAQPLIRDQDLAVAVALHLNLEEIAAGATIIEQGALDTDLFLILEGAVSIAIDGRIAARKNAGEHVGEMAVVDPGAPRSASAIATCDSIVGRIAERDFSMLADRYPRLWRRIALELAQLLRSEYAANHPRGKAEHAA
jgi:CRP/FNR family cyclic AMP-dependent transcriptional regulator